MWANYIPFVAQIILFALIMYCYLGLKALQAQVKDLIEVELVRIKRAMKSNQIVAYKNTVCANCGELLPDNTLRNSDGRWLCGVCKGL